MTQSYIDLHHCQFNFDQNDFLSNYDLNGSYINFGHVINQHFQPMFGEIASQNNKL